ncbi:MAG: DUF1697 domain-containing protein [Pseudomonadota bacterium]
MTLVALLRGINVAGHNTVPMASLRQALTDAGFQNVRTYIQSGNIVVAGSDKAAFGTSLADILATQFGITAPAVCLTADDLQDAHNGCPFADQDPKRVILHWPLGPVAGIDLAEFAPFCTAGEQVHWDGNCLSVFAPNGIGTSKLAGALPRKFPVAVTARNLSTLRKLMDMARA